MSGVTKILLFYNNFFSWNFIQKCNVFNYHVVFSIFGYCSELNIIFDPHRLIYYCISKVLNCQNVCDVYIFSGIPNLLFKSEYAINLDSIK